MTDSKTDPTARRHSLTLESTSSLLLLAREGDAAARDQLFVRYLPRLKQWTHGRLPSRARHLLDTDDLVQVVLVRALSQLGRFEPRREGAFFAYLRQSVMNCRRSRRSA